MSTIQQQILDLFQACEPDVQEVIKDVIQFELANIHLSEPRYKADIMNILDRVARTMSKEYSDEA